jgi:organic hydroperoxide reductase OsmC/OhrA
LFFLSSLRPNVFIGWECKFAKKFFLHWFLKTIMLENILILKVDSRFHGNDRHKQNRPCKTIDKTDEVCPFSRDEQTQTKQTREKTIDKTDEVCPFSWE